MKRVVLAFSVLLMVAALTVSVEAAKKDKTAAATGKAGKGAKAGKGGGKRNKGAASSTSTYTPSTGTSWATATSPTLEGKSVKVADGALTVLPKYKYDAEKDSVKVETNASTVVTIDGTEGKLTDIKPEMTITVTPDTGVATKIEAKTAK